jgi:hypothetical protein
MLKGIQDVKWWDRCMALDEGLLATGTEELPKEKHDHINPRLSGGGQVEEE